MTRSPTARRIAAALAAQPATRADLETICHGARRTIGKILRDGMASGEIKIVAYRQHHGYRGGNTPVPVYGIKEAL